MAMVLLKPCELHFCFTFDEKLFELWGACMQSRLWTRGWNQVLGSILTGGRLHASLWALLRHVEPELQFDWDDVRDVSRVGWWRRSSRWWWWGAVVQEGEIHEGAVEVGWGLYPQNRVWKAPIASRAVLKVWNLSWGWEDCDPFGGGFLMRLSLCFVDPLRLISPLWLWDCGLFTCGRLSFWYGLLPSLSILFSDRSRISWTFWSNAEGREGEGDHRSAHFLGTDSCCNLCCKSKWRPVLLLVSSLV